MGAVNRATTASAAAASRREPQMPTFDTPRPVSARLGLGLVIANVRVAATDRADTTVDIRPSDATSKADLKIAEQTRVDYADGRLEVRAPRLGTLFGRTGSIDVTVALPAGSQVHVQTGMGEIVCDGRLGECRLRTGYGEIRLDRAGAVNLTSASGDVTVDHAARGGEITAGNGAVNVRRIDGPATIRASNGSTWVGEVTGDVRVSGANGSVAVDRAHADVTAKTANGDIRIGEVRRGAVALETAAGSVDVGIRAGSAAWLDLHTSAGRVRNELAAAEPPGATEETVAVRARTSIGDILVRRT
jgi:DUF4097 and DUF4098 domain-containing protein YvlB